MTNRQSRESIKLDAATLSDLVRRMQRLWVQREPPPHLLAAVAGRQRYSTLVHMLTGYHTLLGQHILQLVYSGMSPRSAANHYYVETKRLLTEGWLEREWLPQRSDYAYSLGHWGRVLAAASGRKAGNRRLLRGHDLLTADLMTEMVRRAAPLHGDCTWLGEQDARLTPYLHPDALAQMVIAGARQDCCIEADTGSEELGVFAQKYDKYLSYYAAGDWRERFRRASFPLIVIVTKGKWERLSGMRAAIAERIAASQSQLYCYFTTEELLLPLTQREHSPGPLHEPIWWLPSSTTQQAIWPL